MPSQPLVATLVAASALSELSDGAIARAAQALPNYSGARWLEAGVAADLGFAGDAAALAQARRDLPAALADAPIDAIAQPVAGRRKRLLLADMDSTLIGQECIDELAARVGIGATGRRDHRTGDARRDRLRAGSARTGRSARGPARSRHRRGSGDPDHADAGRADVRCTRCAPTAPMPRSCRAASPSSPARSPRRLGFDEHRANRLIVADGLLVGRVAEPILGRDAKLATLRDLSARLGLDAPETLAIGDGANDLAMLGAAGLGVAYRAKPAVAAAAHARIEHADLTALLYAQGYPRSAFVTP